MANLGIALLPEIETQKKLYDFTQMVSERYALSFNFCLINWLFSQWVVWGDVRIFCLRSRESHKNTYSFSPQIF